MMKMTSGPKRKKIIYCSPLKALSTEKFMDWQKRFPTKKIIMLTGDTLYSKAVRDAQMAECNSADIIICTSELLDSCTRNFSEKYIWMSYVGLIIIDESHILSTGRGHAVEAGIMRFTRLNPKARVLFLSATMPNCGQLADWLTELNGKQTDVIYSTWRPVTLQMHFEEYAPVMGSYGRPNYGMTQAKKQSMAVKLAMSKPDEKFLIFVHDKGTGRQIVRQLEMEREAAVFHNADLDLEDRKEIEASFRKRDGGLRVLVSTSTLAWGSVKEDTLITMANGIQKPVQDLEVGSPVLSWNEKDKRFEQDTVCNFLQYTPTEEIEIELEDGRIIIVDHKHPVYIHTKDGIVQKEAGQLTIDDNVFDVNELE